MVHIHLPKPLHGWREFIGEVGIIVIGVLIALAFEQIVEMVHWQHKVEQASEALRGELETVAMDAAEQQVAASCVQKQLADLQARVTAPGPFKPVPTYKDSRGIMFTVRRPSRLWTDGVWKVVTTEGVSTHLPSEQRADMERLYANIAQAREDSKEANSLTWRLTALGQPIGDDPAGRTRLSEEISELQGRLSLMTLVAGQILAGIDAVKMMPNASDVRASLRDSGTIKFCYRHGLPLGRVYFVPA